VSERKAWGGPLRFTGRIIINRGKTREGSEFKRKRATKGDGCQNPLYEEAEMGRGYVVLLGFGWVNVRRNVVNRRR